MRPLSVACLILLLGGLLLPPQASATERTAAPRTTPERISSAWNRLRGPQDTNLIYLHAAAAKFNIPPAMLATALLTDILTGHADWSAWAKANPEVRSEPGLVQISPATALAEGLLRSDLIVPAARDIFDRKRNDFSYVLNPQPGVDHWYMSCLEAAEEQMADDGVAIGVLARQLRRVADRELRWSRSLEEPYARPNAAQVQRTLSQARAWPDGAEFAWERLNPGPDPWTVPVTAWVYGRYRMYAFDAQPHDELMGLAAQVLAWIEASPAIAAALELPADAPPVVVYTDPGEDYSFQ